MRYVVDVEDHTTGEHLIVPVGAKDMAEAREHAMAQIAEELTEPATPERFTVLHVARIVE